MRLVAPINTGKQILRDLTLGCDYFLSGDSFLDNAGNKRIVSAYEWAVPIYEMTKEVTKEKKLTGGSSSYYTVYIKNPVSEGKELENGIQEPYVAECYDICKALGMTIDEFNIFKAIWRSAAARQGNGKPGAKALYDAEKMVFFSTENLASVKREV